MGDILVNAIIAWLFNQANFGVLAALGTGGAAVLAGLWKVFTYFDSKKSEPDLVAPTPISIDRIDIQFIANSNRFATPANRDEIDLLAAAIQSYRRDINEKYLAAISHINTLRDDWIKDKLQHVSIGELVKVAHRIGMETKWGRRRREIFIDAFVVSDFINIDNLSYKRDISSALSAYLLSQHASSCSFGILPGHAAEVHNLVKAILSKDTDRIGFIGRLDKIHRIRGLVESSKIVNKTLMQGVNKSRSENIQSNVRRLLKSNEDTRMHHSALDIDTNTVANVIEHNLVIDQKSQEFVVLATSERIIQVINGRTEVFRGARDHDIPPPTCHVYEAAYRIFLRNRFLRGDRDEARPMRDNNEFVFPSIMTSSAIRNKAQILELMRAVDQMFVILEPFHRHVCDVIEKEKEERLSELMSWEAQLRSGQQIIKDILASQTDWLSKTGYS
jgi:hypothetical protein